MNVFAEGSSRGLDFAAVDSQPRNNMTLLPAGMAAPRRSRACSAAAAATANSGPIGTLGLILGGFAS